MYDGREWLIRTTMKQEATPTIKEMIVCMHLYEVGEEPSAEDMAEMMESWEKNQFIDQTFNDSAYSNFEVETITKDEHDTLKKFGI